MKVKEEDLRECGKIEGFQLQKIRSERPRAQHIPRELSAKSQHKEVLLNGSRRRAKAEFKIS